MKNILITGVSTGIGYGATQEFIQNGYRVYGSVRKKEDADRLRKTFGESYTPLIFDLTNYESIREAARQLEKDIPDEGLAGLINNAGASKGGPLMHVPLDQFREEFEVFVVGQLAVTQAFLPLLGAKRECVHPPGKIIFISSISGQRAAPFMGPYIAAKHALEGMAKTLRIELQLYGIDVIIVGPGFIKTAIFDKIPDDAYDKYANTDYYESMKAFGDFFKGMVPTESYELDEFSKILFKIFETRKPKTRYALAKNKFKNWTMPGLMPDRMADRYFAKMLEF